MPKPKVTVLNEHKKINPIPREHDNTTDLENAEMRAHQRYKGMRAPDRSVPGKVFTTPPPASSDLPG